MPLIPPRVLLYWSVYNKGGAPCDPARNQWQKHAIPVQRGLSRRVRAFDPGPGPSLLRGALVQARGGDHARGGAARCRSAPVQTYPDLRPFPHLRALIYPDLRPLS
eukprot:1983577-Rhodomonas_salina.1